MDHQSCLDPTNVASLRSELVEAGYGYGDADEHEERRLKEYPMLAGESCPTTELHNSHLAALRHGLPRLRRQSTSSSCCSFQLPQRHDLHPLLQSPLSIHLISSNEHRYRPSSREGPHRALWSVGRGEQAVGRHLHFWHYRCDQVGGRRLPMAAGTSSSAPISQAISHFVSSLLLSGAPR